MKNPEKSAKNIITQRTIKVATAAVIVNNRITTPVTLEIRSGKGIMQPLTLLIPINNILYNEIG